MTKPKLEPEQNLIFIHYKLSMLIFRAEPIKFPASKADLTVPVWSPFPSSTIRVWCPYPTIVLRALCLFPSFPFGVWSPFPSIPFWLTSLLLLWSVNWKLRLSVADEGVEGGRSSLGVGMFEWGRTWKKHIRYIIMDFLSGVFTSTSTTQHCQHYFKQSIIKKI